MVPGEVSVSSGCGALKEKHTVFWQQCFISNLECETDWNSRLGSLLTEYLCKDKKKKVFWYSWSTGHIQWFFSTAVVPSQVRIHSNSLLLTLKSVLYPLPLEPQLWYRYKHYKQLIWWLRQFVAPPVFLKNHDISHDPCLLFVKRKPAGTCSGRKAFCFVPK